MLIQFLLLGFGLIFVNRTIKIQINRKPLAGAILKRLKKTQFTFFLLLTILSTCLSPSLIVILILIPVFLIFHIDKWINFILRQNFQQMWAQFLDELILLMMTGRSFRDAFLFITAHSQNIFHLKLREILFRSDFSENLNPQQYLSNKKSKKLSLNSTQLHFVYELVQSIEKNPHKAIEKLKSHRRQVHWNIKFKNKSKQITLLMRTQALILSLLYIGVLLFVLNHRNHSQFSLTHNSPLFLSLSLFCLGITLIVIIGRKKSWKT